MNSCAELVTLLTSWISVFHSNVVYLHKKYISNKETIHLQIHFTNKKLLLLSIVAKGTTRKNSFNKLLNIQLLKGTTRKNLSFDFFSFNNLLNIQLSQNQQKVAIMECGCILYNYL